MKKIRNKVSASTWDIDYILYTAGAFRKDRKKVSDKEIDKILSEKFIPITEKNISDDFRNESSDISVNGAKRHKNIKKQSKSENSQKKKSSTDNQMIISVFSFLCLVFCIIICLYMIIEKA